jgi:homoserine dehydrogenase
VISGALGNEGVSIEQMLQEGRAPNSQEPVSVLIITHTSREGAVQKAIAAVADRPFMKAPPRLIRIEDL